MKTKNDRTAGLAAALVETTRSDLRHTGHDAQGAWMSKHLRDAAAATGVGVQFGSEVWAKLGWRLSIPLAACRCRRRSSKEEIYGEEQESAAAELYACGLALQSTIRFSRNCGS